MNSIIQMDSDLNHTYTGFGFFDIYNKNSFKQPARTTWIDGWKIEYMAIADPKTIYNTPIVIVGAHFKILTLISIVLSNSLRVVLSY